MATASEILSIARSQIGYTEYPPDSNNTKYGAAYGMNYNPWCMMFVWWCFRQAGASGLFYGGGKTASCPTFERWAKAQRGRWITRSFAPGDVVLYDFDGDGADHCGIVESATAATVTAIEGNTSANGSQDNGGAVLRKTRSLDLVVGAYRPGYQAASASPGTDSEKGGVFRVATLEMISKGSQGAQVRAMQTLLIGYGYSCGVWGADGDCGSGTVAAIRKYQKAHDLTADGICGPLTWASLLGA